VPPMWQGPSAMPLANLPGDRTAAANRRERVQSGACPGPRNTWHRPHTGWPPVPPLPVGVGGNRQADRYQSGQSQSENAHFASLPRRGSRAPAITVQRRLFVRSRVASSGHPRGLPQCHRAQRRVVRPGSIRRSTVSFRRSTPARRDHTCLSARSMSLSRSAFASSPAEKRTSASLIPSSARSSGFNRECVVVAG
jgi:hypothetical protein